MNDRALNPTLKDLLTLCRMDRTWIRGEGAYLFDEKGRRFLDGYAQYGALALGHNHPAVIAAVKAALDANEPAMVQPYRAPWAEKLAAELVRIAPGDFSHCIFTTSGAETVEAAIKLVRARTGRQIILSAHGSFHGKTMGALAATGQPHHAEGFGPTAPGFVHVKFGDATALEQAFATHAPAALILEPIQGEGGVHLPPPGYLAHARALCTQYDAALILDEVQTGLGRTGKLFAGEGADILLVAKALGGGLFPLGAMLTNAKFWDETFALKHSSTFANNNVACRVGLTVLEQLQSLDTAETGRRLQHGLATLAARYPAVIAEVRGQGLLGALELRAMNADAGMFRSYLQHQGLYAYAVASTIAERSGVLVLPTLGGANVVRVAPPLIVTAAQIDAIVSGIGEVCARLARNESDVILRALNAIGPGRVTPKAVRLPLPPKDPECRFAFLAHYTRAEERVLTDPSLARLTPEELEHYSAFAAQLPFGATLRTPPIRSATGATVRGYIISIGMLPEQMLHRGRKHVEPAIIRGVELAHALGAKVVGLGGFTTPYSRRGQTVLGLGPAITTGNALTAGMAFAATKRVAERRGMSLEDLEVAVVGARGSVGALVTKLMARARPKKLLLIGNPSSGTKALEALAETLGCAVELGTDTHRLHRCQIIVSASGAGRAVLDTAPLRSGTILCDVARPFDVSPRVRSRRDLTVIDGGLVALPDRSLRFGPGNLQGLPAGIQLACLCETMLLALAGTTRHHGIGDDVALAEVDEVMALAERHGFRLAEPPVDLLDVRFRARRSDAIDLEAAR